MKEKDLIKAEYSFLVEILGFTLLIVFIFFAFLMWETSPMGALIEAFFGIICGMRLILAYNNSSLRLTNKRIYGKARTLFRTEELDMPINKIEVVSITTTFFGSILGYKTIVIRATNSGWRFNFIVNAEEIREKFYELMDSK